VIDYDPTATVTVAVAAAKSKDEAEQEHRRLAGILEKLELADKVKGRQAIARMG
jgi:hypothetical protein